MSRLAAFFFLGLFSLVMACGENGEPSLEGPTIVEHPSEVSVVEGEAAAFSVIADGEAPLRYQWQKRDAHEGDWLDIEAATDDHYQIDEVALGDDGLHLRVVVANDGGVVESESARLTVAMKPPVIDAHPVDVAVLVGEDATFSVSVTSSGPVSYQWQRAHEHWERIGEEAWSDIEGATDEVYEIVDVALDDDRSYFRAVATNEGGSTLSDSAVLLVNATAPSIVEHPADVAVVEGQTASFSVEATGTDPLGYQWQILEDADWSDIEGATDQDFEIAQAALDDDGLKVRVQVSNPADAVSSDGATLSVAPWDGAWKVDGQASEAGDGRTWETAFSSLTEALEVAAEGEEIWVVAGSYVPGDEREDSFVLVPGVGLYGGFDGTEVAREERDHRENETILSGDLGVAGDPDDNAYHVVLGADDAILDGFSIVDGNALGSTQEIGGGLLMTGIAGMTVANCRFENNLAIRGGAIAIDVPTGANTIKNSLFVDNWATNAGGAIFQNDSPAQILNSEFRGNGVDLDAEDPEYGGAIFNYGALSTGSIINSTFYDNLAPSGGGTIHNRAAQTSLANLILWGNTAPGGEVTSSDGGNATMIHSCVEGGYQGEGNIDDNPIFVDPDDGDLSLDACSPAIDAAQGDLAPETDLFGAPRFDDPAMENRGVAPQSGVTWADMGAYERQEASGDGPLDCRLPVSCRELQQYEPTTPTGQYTIEPPGGYGPMEVFCDMTTDGGGWTLVAVSAQNGTRWTWNNRTYFTTDQTVFGSLSMMVPQELTFVDDYKNLGIHAIDIWDVKIRWASSTGSKWASYHNVSDGSEPLSQVIEATPVSACHPHNLGYPKSAGDTIGVYNTGTTRGYCGQRLYFNLRDIDGGSSPCGFGQRSQSAFGPSFNYRNNEGQCTNGHTGPFDEPCYTGFGPCHDMPHAQVGVVNSSGAWADLGLDGTRRSMLLYVR